MKKDRPAPSALLLVCIILIAASPLQAQEPLSQTQKKENAIDALDESNKSFEHRLDMLEKAVDDVLWYHKASDVAWIDKAFITGPPPAKVANPTAMGAGNPVKFWTYVFIPKNRNPGQKLPLLVLPHGGVHGDFTTYHTHIIREFMAQGYAVVAPEYRGSTGYGKAFYEKIDYGGLEVEDAHASMKHMLDNYGFLDSKRVGMVGWSHGGMIALLAVFEHPGDYAACFAGVPVSDLVARMGYSSGEYRDMFSADYHIGQTAEQNVSEYKKRSPAWNAKKLKTPLLIHANTIDEDVNVLEVEHLIQALKAEKKSFEYEIFQGVPGGHSFDRMDTKQAREIRLKIHRFLAKILSPPNPFKNLQEMEKAAYPQ